MAWEPVIINRLRLVRLLHQPHRQPEPVGREEPEVGLARLEILARLARTAIAPTEVRAQLALRLEFILGVYQT